jgi:hypothetical protein
MSKCTNNRKLQDGPLRGKKKTTMGWGFWMIDGLGKYHDNSNYSNYFYMIFFMTNDTSVNKFKK